MKSGNQNHQNGMLVSLPQAKAPGRRNTRILRHSNFMATSEMVKGKFREENTKRIFIYNLAGVNKKTQGRKAKKQEHFLMHSVFDMIDRGRAVRSRCVAVHEKAARAFSTGSVRRCRLVKG